jgi:hypothetical protein
MKLKLLLTLSLFANIVLLAQEKKFFVGLNVGVKFANKNYAFRHTGAYQNELPTLLSNQQIHNQLYLLLNNQDFEFVEHNENFKYTPAINYGVLLGYAVTPNLQASIDANFCQPKVQTTYTIKLLDPGNQTSQDQYRVGSVLGKEGRFNGKFNLDYIFDADKIKFIIGVQGLFLSWRMEQLIYELADEQWIYNSYSVHNVANNFTKKTSGSGWGYGLNLGFEYRLNEKFVAQFTYQPYLSRIEYFYTKAQIEQLESSGSNYPGISNRLEHDITLRILWK